MRIPIKEYTFESFIEEIMSLELPPTTRLKTACFMTHSRNWEEENASDLHRIFSSQGFQIEKMGDMRVLRSYYFDPVMRRKELATFYAYLNPDSRLLLCFTDEKTYAIDKTIGGVADTSSGLFYMFINPRVFQDVRSKIMEEFPKSRCIYFTAKHVAQYAKRGETRPDIEKTLIYHGDDALETLEEVRQYYGVSPRVMRYRIPEMGTYEVKSTGCFAIWAEEDPGPARRFLLDLVNSGAVGILRSREIIEKADFVLIPLKTEQKAFSIPRLSPWIIKFGKQLDFSDAQSLLEAMVGNGYTFFNYAITKGSLRLNGMVLDEKKNNLFTIDLDTEKMVIAPRGKIPFDGFMRFFATIVESFDPEATIEEFA